MYCSRHFNKADPGKSGLALNLFDDSIQRFRAPIGEVIITVTASSVTKMLPGTSYVGALDHQ
jgi:hypothetical protein